MLQWQALGACAGGMAFFAALYGVAAYADKASTVPYVRSRPEKCSRVMLETMLVVDLMLGPSAVVTELHTYSPNHPKPSNAQAPRSYPYDELKSEMGGEQRQL